MVQHDVGTAANGALPKLGTGNAELPRGGALSPREERRALIDEHFAPGKPLHLKSIANLCQRRALPCSSLLAMIARSVDPSLNEPSWSDYFGKLTSFADTIHRLHSPNATVRDAADAPPELIAGIALGEFESVPKFRRYMEERHPLLAHELQALAHQITPRSVANGLFDRHQGPRFLGVSNQIAKLPPDARQEMLANVPLETQPKVIAFVKHSLNTFAGVAAQFLHESFPDHQIGAELLETVSMTAKLFRKGSPQAKAIDTVEHGLRAFISGVRVFEQAVLGILDAAHPTTGSSSGMLDSIHKLKIAHGRAMATLAKLCHAPDQPTDTPFYEDVGEGRYATTYGKGSPMFGLIDALIDPATPRRIVMNECPDPLKQHLAHRSQQLEAQPPSQFQLDGVAHSLQDALFRLSEQKRLAGLDLEGRCGEEVRQAWLELGEEIEQTAKLFAHLRPVTLDRALARLEQTGLQSRIPEYAEHFTEFSALVSRIREADRPPSSAPSRDQIASSQELYRELRGELQLPRRCAKELARLADSNGSHQVLRNLADTFVKDGRAGGTVLFRLLQAHPSLLQLNGGELDHFLQGIRRSTASEVLAILDGAKTTRELRRAIMH